MKICYWRNCGKAGQIAPDLLIFQDMSITQILMWILYIFKWWLWCDEANPLLSKLTHSPGGSKGPQFDTCRVELDQVADSSLSSRCWCPGKLPRWATPSSKGCLLSLFAKKCSFCKPLKKFLTSFRYIKSQAKISCSLITQKNNSMLWFLGNSAKVQREGVQGFCFRKNSTGCLSILFFGSPHRLSEPRGSSAKM